MLVKNFGLDMQRVIKETDIFVWDIDGVLATYAYGLNGVNACLDKDYEKYLSKHDLYETAQASKLIKTFIEKYVKNKKHYVASSSYSKLEDKNKRDFVQREYGIYIPENHVYLVDDKKKKLDIMNMISKRENNKNITMVDDTSSLLSYIADNSDYKTLHVSSFLNFEI